jgi:hypothetical protein
MKFTFEMKTNILYGLFVGSLIAANLMGLKVASFGFFEASVGILLFPILFLVTDIIEEVHGKEKTKELVFVGFVVLVVVLIITAIAVLLPFAERSLVKDEYTTIFGTTIRIFIASITAFFVSQMHDVWAFNFWKKKTKGKYLWLRNNFSTIVSTFIDTTLFMFIAFYGVTLTSYFDPAASEFTVEYVFTLIIPYWLVKVLFALFDTPFCYLGVQWLKGSAKNK